MVELERSVISVELENSAIIIRAIEVRNNVGNKNCFSLQFKAINFFLNGLVSGKTMSGITIEN